MQEARCQHSMIDTKTMELTDEDILASYDNADFTRTITEIGYDERLDNSALQWDSSTPWQIPANAEISSAGRKIVGKDPNISSETLKRLLVTESRYLTEKDRERFLTCSKEQIVKAEFFSHKNIGQAHLAQCIRENLYKPLANLIYTYSDDRRIPFILGALYIEAFRSCYRFYYYSYSEMRGYKRVAWAPAEVYVPPISMMPPHPKRKNFKKYYDPVAIPQYTLPKCPCCGSPAKMLRTGYRSKLWHVCCTDRSEKCQLFLGLEPAATEQDAVKNWQTFCEQLNEKKSIKGDLYG